MGNVWGEICLGRCDAGSKFVEAHNAMQRNIVTQANKEFLSLIGDNEVLVGDAAAYRLKRDIISARNPTPYLIFSCFSPCDRYPWLP